MTIDAVMRMAPVIPVLVVKDVAHSLPVAQAPQTFELRMAGYRKKTRDIVVTGNTVITIPLDKAPAAVVVPTHRGSAHHNSSDDLERPE